MGNRSRRRRGWTLALGLILLMFAAPAWAGGLWVKVAGGVNGMAMDDINDGTYRFHETSIHGFNFPDLNSGFGLSFHAGNDISPRWSFGFSWEIQHGHVQGTDVDVSAVMKLDADFFMGHLYWTPVRSRKFSLGAAGGLGIVSADGTVRIEQGNVNFGQNKTSGTDLAFELMGTAEYALAGNKALQLTLGWREAKVDKITYQGTTATREDGSDLALDYSGYTARLGVLWRFGAGPGGAGPNIQ